MANIIEWTPDTPEAGGYVVLNGEAYTTSTALCDAIAAGKVPADKVHVAGAYALALWARYDWYIGSTGEYRKTGQSAAASADTGTFMVVLEARARSIVAIDPDNKELAAAIERCVEFGRVSFEARRDSAAMSDAVFTAAQSIY